MLLESTVETQEENTDPSHPSTETKETDNITDSDMEKVRSTLRQFVRDWSEDGIPEREATYTPILNALNKHFGALSIPER